LKVQRLSQTSVDATGAVTRARDNAIAAESTAHRLAHDALDHIIAWQDREAVRAAGDWQQSIAAADTAYTVAVTAADDAMRQAANLVPYRLRAAVARQHATEMADARGGAHDDLPGTALSALFLYQAEVAAAAADHADKLHDAERSLQADWTAANRNLAGKLTTAEEHWVSGLAAVQQEHVDRLSAAIVSRSEQLRAAAGHLQLRQRTAATTMQRTLASAQRDFLQSLAADQTAFETARSAAARRWAIDIAQARAALRRAGGRMEEALSRDDGQRTDAERAFVQALTLAAADYRFAVQHANVIRAEGWGNALVAYHVRQGQAGTHRAQAVATDTSHFAAVSGAAEVAYAVAATEAARRQVQGVAAAEAAFDTSFATAHQDWIHALGLADKNHAASVGAAREHREADQAIAEWHYHVAVSGPQTTWNEIQQVRQDWLQAAGPGYLQYRVQLATADTRLNVQQAAAAAAREDALADAHWLFIVDKQARLTDFASAEVTAVNTFHMLVVDADNLLMAQLADADGRRNTHVAQFLASHDLALARAARDHAVSIARLAATEATTDADRQQALAVARAERDYEVGLADAERLWSLAAIAAEEWHTAFIVSATKQLDQAVGANHARLAQQAGGVAEQWTIRKAQVETDFVRQLHQGIAEWRLAQADSQDQWQSAQWLAARVSFENLVQRTAWPWAQYQADRAGAMAQWTAQWRLDRQDWISGINTAELQCAIDVGAAYLDYAADTSAAQTRWISGHAANDQRRRDSIAGSREQLAQQLIPAAKSADLTKTAAQFSYRVALADAGLTFHEIQNQVQFESTVADATSAYWSAVQDADQQYTADHGLAVADDQRRRMAAQSVWSLDQLAADEQWRFDRALAEADWQDELAQAMAARQQALTLLDAEYGAAEAGAVDAVYQQLAGSDGSPWSIRDAAWHAAESLRQQQQRAALGQWAESTASQERQQRLAVGAADRELAMQAAQASHAYRDRWRLEARDLADAQLSAHQQFVAYPAMPREVWRDLGVSARLDGVSWIESLIYGGGMLAEIFDPQGTGLLFQLGTLSSFWLTQSPSARSPIRARVQPMVHPGRLPAGMMFRPGMEAERAAMEQMPRTAVTDSELVSRSRLRWFQDDLGLMARYPGATASGLTSGAGTSAKVFVNGTLSSVKSAATLGFAKDPWEVLAVTEDDYANGYQPAFGILRISQELLVGAITGKLATPDKAGRYSKWGRRAFHFDMAQNTVSSGRGAYNVAFGEGWTFGNSVELIGGLFGVTGNVLSRPIRTTQSLPANSGDLLDHGLGLGVVLSGKKDKIGHAFVVLELPDGTRRAYGFYPTEDYDVLNVKHLKRLLGVRDDFPAEVLSDLDYMKAPGTRITMFPVTREQYQRALVLIAETIDQTANGTLRYNLCSQCATFARNVLRHAGVQPFVPLPYPPLMYWTMWLGRRL
jgi:hypothetical protein